MIVAGTRLVPVGVVESEKILDIKKKSRIRCRAKTTKKVPMVTPTFLVLTSRVVELNLKDIINEYL